MKVALIIDEALRSDHWFNNFFEDVEYLGDHLGMRSYSVLHRGGRVKIYFFNSTKDAIALRTEDLFLFEDLEIIVNVGYCFCSPEQNKVFDSDIVVLSTVKCDHRYREALKMSDDIIVRKSYDLEKRLERRLLDSADKLNMSVKSVCCCSVTSLEDLSCLQDAKLVCGCFDQKAFAIYEVAKKYNRNALCLYRTRSHNLIDLQHYLLEKPDDALDDLIQIALEFEFRCRAK